MRYLLTIIACCAVFSLMAFKGPGNPKSTHSQKGLQYKMNCAQATAETDLDINNVRARLLIGGDFGWDGDEARYIVPNVGPGEPEVSSIFAGAVWMGGIDPGGNLKLAAQQFGTGSGNSDYWPGPITDAGLTQPETCANWDRFFTVTSAEIDQHIAQYLRAQNDNTAYDVDLIPNSVKEWPALGNEFFFELAGFELPFTQQGLAPFFDQNGDGIYTPQFGDHPVIEARGCPALEYADEMNFWIFNDVGNIHTESRGESLQMEIQALSYAYATGDELNDMTFTSYKLINRAQESLLDTYFGIWLDADLGCSEDDFVGCDTIRDMMYIYNSDALDGSSGPNCTGGVSTYADRIPYLGVDYLRGPLAPKVFGPNGELIDPDLGQTPDTLIELGMNSFVYINRASVTTDPITIDPGAPQEYYNILSGFFNDGSPLTVGGSGIGGTVETKFAFHDEPNDENGWSMCTANLRLEDRRTVQASGPFRLDPGQVNELVIGIPWVPNVTYPCPDMGRLFRADDIAQRLFDSCFERVEGPDAPDLTLTPMDQKVVGLLTNDEVSSNNAQEGYSEIDFLSPPNLSIDERSYKFEGYVVYQLLDKLVARSELDNPERARIAFQSDRVNEAADIFNWLSVPNPDAGPLDDPNIFMPFLQVEGANQGVMTSFELTTDLFTDNPLINQNTYYYLAIAYGFNEYEPFDPVSQTGQPTPYITSSRNIRTYTVIPQADPNVMENSGAGAIITRLDGEGAGNNFLSISDEERNRILEAQEVLPAEYFGDIVYQQGAGPLNIKVIDPLNVIEGNYFLRFDQDTSLLLGNSAWEVFDAQTNESLGRADQSLQNQTEQFFPDLGFSVTIGQTTDAGDGTGFRNGAIGQMINYADPAKSWLTPVLDDASTPEVLQSFDTHYLPTGGGELNSDLDPRQAFTNLGSGNFAPYTLMDYTLRADFYATPAWLNSNSQIVQGQNPLQDLNNVDVVFTNDKSKWSRCVVVESGNRYFTNAGFELDDFKDNFDVVARPSVSRQDNDGDGRPDPDGTGTGFAWFPGYAIDVETGTRLNIFFGENSAFGDNTVEPSLLDAANGSDMMFNPSAQAAMTPDPNSAPNPFDLVLGGMHYMYVTKQPYDECALINEALSESSTFRKIPAFEVITWAGIGLGAPVVPLLSYADGLIPTETVVELRVDNPYSTALGMDDNNSFPSYGFTIVNTPTPPVSTTEVKNEKLDQIVLYPNPVLQTAKLVLKNGQRLKNVSQVDIYNAAGALQLSIQNIDNSDLELDVHDLNSGIYFYKVYTIEEDLYLGKFVKM